jgi:phospholipid/cholesterol/gamma-HCH transport system ATP-binding protein
MVEVQRLSHSFGAVEVLHEIDFSVAKGEILAIMGSSGGGKTTLLRCISGLIRPTKGDVLVDGISSVREPERARERLGFVFQSAALFDYLTVEENVLFGAVRRRRLGRGEREALLEETLGRVGLMDARGKTPSELSGGMRKRVGLARALAMKPSALLYDEPTSGLDPVTAYSIDELIVGTGRELKVTSVVVSHDVTSVFRVADRIAFLHEGRLRFVGTVSEFEASTDVTIDELVRKSEARSLA